MFIVKPRSQLETATHTAVEFGIAALVSQRKLLLIGLSSLCIKNKIQLLTNRINIMLLINIYIKPILILN